MIPKWPGGPANPTDAVKFQQVAVEKMCVAVRHMLDQACFRSETDLLAYQDQIIRQLVYEVRAYVASSRKPEVVETKVEHVPADWWQAARQRWCPAWWLRRYPVVLRDIVIRRVEQRVKLCPHIATKGGPATEHYNFLATPWDDAREEIKSFKLLRFVRALADDGKYSVPGYEFAFASEVSPRVLDMAKKLLEEVSQMR